MLKC